MTRSALLRPGSPRTALTHAPRGIALLVLLTVTAAASAAEPAPRTVQQLAWLAGCWASAGGEPGSGEQWMAPAGGTMLGMGRTVRNGRTVDYEHLLLRETPAGGIEYVAKPFGQAETTFPLVRLGEREVVFENPQHDFPQRVLYRLEDGGSLKARIEGEVDGRARGIDFPLRKVDCASPLVAAP